MLSPHIEKIFKELKRHDLPVTPHKKNLYLLGSELADVSYRSMGRPQEPCEIYMASYDAHYLGKGFFETISQNNPNSYLKCFWYDRATFEHTDEVCAHALTIFKQKDELQCDKAIIVSSSPIHHPENRALITRALESDKSKKIYFCSPVISVDDEAKIRNEFSNNVNISIISLTQNCKLQLDENASTCGGRKVADRTVPSLIRKLFDSVT